MSIGGDGPSDVELREFALNLCDDVEDDIRDGKMNPLLFEPLLSNLLYDYGVPQRRRSSSLLPNSHAICDSRLFSTDGVAGNQPAMSNEFLAVEISECLRSGIRGEIISCADIQNVFERHRHRDNLRKHPLARRAADRASTGAIGLMALAGMTSRDATRPENVAPMREVFRTAVDGAMEKLGI